MQPAARSHVAPRRGVEAPELPRHQDRVGDLVELQVGPVRRAVDVAVLREASVGQLLAGPQVVERPSRRRSVAGGDLRGRHLVEVARPDEVVRAGVARDRAPHPGHRRRGDAGARIRLVLERGHDHQRDVVERLLPAHARRTREAAEIVVPATRVAACRRIEVASDRGRRRALGCVGGGTEAERDRRVPVAPQPVHRDPRGLDDVPGRARPVVGPVHAEVVAQVGPAVARAHVPVRGAPRRRVARHRHGVAGVPRGQAAGTVVVAGVGERRVEQRVELVRPSGERLEPHANEHGRARRVGDVGLGQPPAARAGRVDLAVGEAAPVDEPHAVPGILPVALGEGASVGDDELQVAHARRAEVGRVHLGHRAVVEREPHLAVAARRGAHAVLVALRPRRDRAGRTRGIRGGRVPRRPGDGGDHDEQQ